MEETKKRTGGRDDPGRQTETGQAGGGEKGAGLSDGWAP